MKLGFVGGDLEGVSEIRNLTRKLRVFFDKEEIPVVFPGCCACFIATFLDILTKISHGTEYGSSIQHPC